MAATHRQARIFKVLLTIYAAGLFVWLAVGLLPTLSDNLAWFHEALHRLAGNDDATGRAASRIVDAHSGSMEHEDAPVPTGEAIVQYAFSLLNVALALVLAAKRPHERVPQLLAFALLGTAGTFNLASHRAFHVLGSPWPISVAHFTFHIASGVCYLWAVVLFPHGSLPRAVRMSRLRLRFTVLLVTVAVALVGWRGSFLSHPQFFIVFFGIAIAVAGEAAQVLRLREGSLDATGRRAVRLLCAALLPAFGTAVMWSLARLSGANAVTHWAAELFPAVFAIVPTVLCVAIVRYRLWDIDRLLSGVLAYGLILAAMTGGYVLALLLGSWLAGSSQWPTVLVLGLVAAGAEPLWRHGHRWANRVVYGQSLSPAEAVRDLIDGLEQMTPTAEVDLLTSVAVRATRAASAQLWVSEGGREQLAAQTGSGRPLGTGYSWPVLYRGEQLGRLVVHGGAGARLTAGDLRVLRDLAAHAGLVLHNVRMTVRLARQAATLEERAATLHAARRHLVQTQDAERERLERNLHDGAQQALVAAMIGARNHGSPERLQEILAEARSSLIELCGDGRPAVLAERGLAGALGRAAQLARQAGLRVEVAVAPGELDSDVEAAVYFCCTELLQNTVKHAAARRVAVVVTGDADAVHFAVEDDGRGLPADVPDGGDLGRLGERLAPLDGRVAVVPTGTGTGTRVEGVVPLRGDLR